MGKRLSLVLTLVLALAMIGTSLTYAGGRGQKGQRGDRSQMTEEQKAERRAKMQERKESAGAKLTEEQRTAIREKVEALKAEGKSREEIRAARSEMLKEYGVDVPERGQRQRPGNRLGAKLTEAQRTEIKAMVQKMKAEAASSEDIRKAVREKVQAYGEQPAAE